MSYTTFECRRRNTCPKWQKDCNREQTVPPISQYLNLLNNLIKFNCVENGCHEVVRLGSLSSYSEECIHKICVSCRLKTGPNVEYNCSELIDLIFILVLIIIIVALISIIGKKFII